jgi:hypothetical protein
MFARARIPSGDIVVGRWYVLGCGVWRKPIVRDEGLAIDSVLYLCIYVDLQWVDVDVRRRGMPRCWNYSYVDYQLDSTNSVSH